MNTNKKIKNYNIGVDYLISEDEFNYDVYGNLKTIQKELKESLTLSVKALIEKYRHLVYPDDSYVDERNLGKN